MEIIKKEKLVKFIHQICKNKRIGLTLLLLCSASVTPLFAATFTVTTTADNGDNISPITGSLRKAILDSNSHLGSNTIIFNFGSALPPFIIQPIINELPPISNTVTIDGYYGAPGGARRNTLSQGDNAILTVVLNGSNYTVGDGLTFGNGLHFVAGSDNSVVTGLVINQWIDSGILVDTTNAFISGISIVGNFIGTDDSGTVEMANRTGIGLSGLGFGCVNTNIGSTAVGDRNIIAGSFAFGDIDIYAIQGSCIFSYFNLGTQIINNYIGTDKNGTVALGNSQIGAYIRYEFDSTTRRPIIGGSTPDARNIISGHLLWGIRLRASSDCLVQGNYIGTDRFGTHALGNSNLGIGFDDNFDITGGTVGSTILGNLISGNGTGIRIGDNAVPGATLNTIQNNLIGTDFTGSGPLPNTRFGIVVDDQQNTITGNTISGNLGGGVLIYSIIGTQNIFSDNFIGLDSTGTMGLSNGGNGAQIGLYSAVAGPSSNTIGS